MYKKRHPIQSFADGQVLLFDKPLHWTSFDVIKKVRAVTGVRKVGHAGTLDPLATGLLIVCTGKFTKQINTYMGMEKEYTGTFTLGSTTPTFDLESEPQNFINTMHLAVAEIVAATKIFIGTIQQIPPAHSAIKKNGQALYVSARKGITVVIEPRTITIKEFEVTNISLPIVNFRVVCSTGTYIRSLANDFGAALGVGGYMSSLRRTRIGNVSVNDALLPIDFVSMVEAQYYQTAVTPLDTCLNRMRPL